MAHNSQESVFTQREIVGELRRIRRRLVEFQTPLFAFRLVPERAEERARYQVIFSRSQLPFSGSGVQLGGVSHLSIPDERLEDAAYDLCGSMFHLKDRVRRYARQCGGHHVPSFDPMPRHIGICGDLINYKKHGGGGRGRSYSSLHPRMGQVLFDLSKSGSIEFQKLQPFREAQLLVEETVPIPILVDVVEKSRPQDNESGSPKPIMSLVDLATGAMVEWRRILTISKVFEASDESIAGEIQPIESWMKDFPADLTAAS